MVLLAKLERNYSNSKVYVESTSHRATSDVPTLMIESSEEFETHPTTTSTTTHNKRRHSSRHARKKKRKRRQKFKTSVRTSRRLLNTNAQNNVHQKKSRMSGRREYDRSSPDTSLLMENRFDSKHNYPRAVVRDHLYMAIFGLLCFFPTGIFGLIRATQACEMKQPLSVVYWPQLAAIYGRYALRWAVLSVLIGTTLWTIFIIYRLVRDQSSF